MTPKEMYKLLTTKNLILLHNKLRLKIDISDTMKKLFLILLCCFCSMLSFGNEALATTSIMFRQLSTNEGLSNNNVRCILRDNKGYLWIGIQSGLNKYDGYTFQHYYRNNSQLPDDGISELFEGPDGNVWVKSANGYSIYNYQTGIFENNYKQKLDSLGILGKNILQVGHTTNGNECWAYDHSKLYLRNLINGSLKTIPLEQTDKISNIIVGTQYIYIMYIDATLQRINRYDNRNVFINIPDLYKQQFENHDAFIYSDRNENLWAYTLRSSLLLHLDNKTWKWESINLGNDSDIQYNRVQGVLDLGNGDVWILTTHRGLFIYNKLTKQFTNLVHDPLKPHTLASNNLNTIYQDKDGTVWIGNYKHGISYYNPNSQIILSHRSLEYDDILAFCQDSSFNNIYYGTDGKGIIRESLTDGKRERIATPANIIVYLSYDAKGRLWAGSYQKGLLCYHNGRIRQYTTTNSKLLEDNVYAVEADRNGYIWIGTLKGFIQRLDPDTDQFETILYRPEEFTVSDMFYDGDQHIYVATHEGLIVINTDTQAYNIYNEAGRFKENDINTVYKDSRNLLWMGHPHGLSIWNLQNDSVTFIKQKDGLPANLVRAIIEDEYGQMWIGSGNGISRIRLKDDKFTIVNYSVSDGLMCNDANVHAIMRLKNGHILVGTPQGYQTIVPQKTTDTPYNASVYLTGIELQSGVNPNKVLGSYSPECITQLVLPEEENSFTLSLSALDLMESDKVKYAYRIAGQRNDKWLYAENNKVHLSMLQPGNYQLQFKVCNSQGVWSPNIKELKVKVLPPWYNTWWAYTTYALLATTVVLLIIQHLHIRQKERRQLREVEEENERQQKLTNIKLQFFANISHELRTPLSLIINPLEEFFVNHPEYRTGLLDIVKHNADYLLEQINQLLDFRKLDAKAETLHCYHDNVLILLSEIFNSFNPIAHKRNIDYRMKCSKPSVFMDFDYDKIRKIVTNLLSNAFKFTPDGGNISLDIQLYGGWLTLRVVDTGCGIEDKAKEKIFQRFYQPANTPSNKGGSGIGLHITSEYVKMHGGTICVHDNQPCGSIFEVVLPIHQGSIAVQNSDNIINTKSDTIEDKWNDGLTILLVDDNSDFLHFLSESLSKLYHVLNATNGKLVLNMLEEEDIDLVVSDVMMPEMDGVELCKTIKTDIRYSHIPVILLTAKANEEHQLEGLGVGADDYIIKPFNMEVLKLRIHNLIEMGHKRHEFFNEQIKIEPSRITITPLDQQMVEKAIQIVEENIGKPEFSVEELATSLNISRSYFYKKMVKITGKKPIEFIRTIRMKRACQLLAESQMQIAEIAYMLGYNSPKVFSKHFKEEFGVSPSEFKNQ